ncbi:MAG: hypothetical protein Q9227_002239 [Pyrenula ochraceoflavens]
MTIAERFGKEGQACLLFTTLEAAEACKSFASASHRKEMAMSPEEISVRIFDMDHRIYAAFFPATKAPCVMDFWSHPGCGISTRWAEESLNHLDLLREVSAADPASNLEEDDSHALVRNRIAELLERNPVGSQRATKVSSDDVYLFNTGMSAMYYLHTWLNQARKGKTIQVAFPFHSTFDNLEFFSPDYHLIPRGDKSDLDELETFLRTETSSGRQIQALWAEFPSNPQLLSPDLSRLRSLATKYNFPLIIDDTISSFANVDVLAAGADIIWTSITKSFSGRSDVMGGSLALNPNSPFYPFFKSLFTTHFQPTIHPLDAAVLAKNSEDYLPRTIRLNTNAEAMADYFYSCALNPKNPVTKIHYPKHLPSRANYDAYMRPPSSPDLPNPGYGCLMSVEFESVETTRAFYDNLHVHQGPHLGAQVTLGLAYVKGILGKELDRVAKFGLNERMIRISAGWTEEKGDLVRVCEFAVGKAVEEKGMVERMVKGLEMPGTVA